MRLFIAINFDNDVKEYLKKIQTHLKSISKKGSFSHDENLHLTLLFLGEVEPDKIEDIKQAMDSINNRKFELSIGGIGRFKRERGDIIWVNADKNKELISIYNKLNEKLSITGFDIQSRDYKPHITLARNVKLSGDLGIIPPPYIKTGINQISLMKSKRIEGRLTYTEIFAKELS